MRRASLAQAIDPKKVRPMASPLEVVVIIVNYRSAAHCLRALASVAKERAGSQLAISAIVVENHSGDEAELRQGIQAEYADFCELVVSPVNGGYGAGNNLGLKVACERHPGVRYFHFLNPDTEVRPGAISGLVDFLEAHPRAGVAGSTFEHADGTPWPVAFRFPSPLGELEGGACIGLLTRLLDRYKVPLALGEAASQVDWLSGASMMFRREALERVGGFDEGFFLYFEETDLCLRTKKAGFEIWYVPASRVMHVRGQSTGVTSLDDKPRRLPQYWFESRRRYFTKHYGLRFALAADVAFLLGNGIGRIKHRIEGHPVVPQLLGDFVRESVIVGRNRTEPAPERCFMMPREAV